MLAKPKSLIERISTALARGMPDNESTGCTVPELLKLLAECRDEITGNRQPEAEPVPQHTHDEIYMPENDEVERLSRLVESTQRLLGSKVREVEELLHQRNQYRLQCMGLRRDVEKLSITSKDEAKRRIEKIEKHLNALKETING